MKTLLLIPMLCFALVSCESIHLPGDKEGSAQFHPSGLPCGYPAGVLLSARDAEPAPLPAEK